MPNDIRTRFLQELGSRVGPLRKIGNSQSLFEFAVPTTRLYVRYSKIHSRGQAFFGLRGADLRLLEGHNAYIALLWDDQEVPLILSFAEFEDVFNESTPASDGQVKVQVYKKETGTELYVSRAGRFKVDAYYGWDALLASLIPGDSEASLLGHAQVQTLLGAIGAARNFDIWIPLRDRLVLDWTLCERFNCAQELLGVAASNFIAQEIDVIWLERGSGRIRSAYEVEHSTTIYSGLLRLNDARISAPWIDSFGIVANDERKSTFARHLRRPTFQASGLDSVCSFLNYDEVLSWYRRVYKTQGTRGLV